MFSSMSSESDLGGSVVVVWGPTGSGKSTLANRLLGFGFDLQGKATNTDPTTPFGVSSCSDLKTCITSMKSGHWFGDPNLGKVTIIDTPGLGQDSYNINNITEFLKTKSPRVHLFLLVFNSLNSRFDNNIQEIITLFDETFSRKIWDNVALCFTKHPQDSRSRRVRAGEYKALGDSAKEKEEWVQKKIEREFTEYIKNHLGAMSFPNTPCIFIDSVPDEDDTESMRIETAKYFKFIRKSAEVPPFLCKDIIPAKHLAEVLSEKHQQSEEILQDYINLVQNNKSPENKAQATNLNLDFKNNYYGYPYKEKTLSVELTVKNSSRYELHNIFYRIVYIFDTRWDSIVRILNIPLPLTTTIDANSDLLYNDYDNYFAKQEFQISNLKQGTVTSPIELKFVPTDFFVNSYHYIEADYIAHLQVTTKKKTKSNWAVQLQKSDTNYLQLIFFEDKVDIISSSTEFSTKME